MAKRTDKVSVEVPTAVREDLNAYIGELHAVLNRRASQGEIIGAMVAGVPLWQVAAMLDAYRPRDDPGSSGAPAKG